MANDHMIRASDRDREAVVAVLRDAYTAGRLNAEEFDERTTAAYSGRTWGELRTLTEDLPEQPALGADLPSALPPAVTHTGPPRDRRAGRRPIVPIFPIFTMWFLITVAAHSPAAAPLAVIGLVMLMIVVSSGRRRRHGGAPGRDGYRDVRRPGDNRDAPLSPEIVITHSGEWPPLSRGPRPPAPAHLVTSVKCGRSWAPAPRR